MAARRGNYNVKQAPTCGFDIMADALSNHFFEAMGSPPKTLAGVVNTAHKELKTSFKSTLKGTSSNAINNVTITPATTRRDGSISNASPTRPSPVLFALNPDDGCDAVSTVRQLHYMDKQSSAFSCNDLPPRRLKPHDVVRLRYHDEFSLFIPPTSKNDSATLKKARDAALSLMRSMIVYEIKKTMTAVEREEFIREELKCRQVERNGKFGYQFHLRVLAYPERSALEQDPIRDSEIRHLLLPQTGVGITVQLIGYPPTASVLLKLYNLALLELYVPRLAGECVYDTVALPNSKKDDAVASALSRELLETKGDVTAYLGVLMQYYQAERKRNKPAADEKMSYQQNRQVSLEPTSDELLRNSLSADVTDDKLRSFANTVDEVYKTAIRGCVQFTEVCEFLVDPDVHLHFYNKFRQEFPYLHHALYTAAESKTFEDELDDEDQLISMKKKNRQILYLFYGLIRTHSSWLMKYWAIVEPLGCYYKGHQQPGSKSFGGSFSASLPTAWGALETIYKEEFLSFMSSLEEETTLTGAFDNYQKVIPKKDITAFKSAITHVGTSHFLKMNKPIPYPIDTVIRSPAGVHFRVTHCDYDDSGKYIVKGIVASFKTTSLVVNFG